MIKGLTTVIEITDTELKLMQAKDVRGTLHVQALDTRALSQQSINDFQRTLLELTRQQKIEANNMVLVLPRRMALFKQLRLPSVNDSEIKQMAGLQLVNKIPFALEDILWDTHILAKDSSGYTTVLATIVQRNSCEQYLQAFDDIGLSLSKISLSSFGVLGWLNYQLSRLKDNNENPIAILNIETSQSEMCFCQNGKLLHSRHIGFGMRHLNTTDLTQFVKQVEQSIDFYVKENMGGALSMLYIVESLYDVAALKDQLENKLRITISVLDSLEHTAVVKKVQDKMRTFQGSSFAVPLGLAHADVQEYINLTPKEVHASKRSKVLRRQLVTLVVLSFLSVGIALAIFGMQLNQQNSVVNQLQDQLKTAKAQAQKAEDRIAFINDFKSEFQGRVIISELVAELLSLTPDEISYRSITLDDQKRLSIQGYAQSSSSVNNFQAVLVKSQRFTEVNLQRSTKRKLFNTEVSDFKIVARLEEGEEE